MLLDLRLIEPKRFLDARGFFVESFNEKRWVAEMGAPSGFVQDNMAQSDKRGTVRGLHFQAPPHAQAKLVMALRGAIFDVVVDIRQASPTYGQWYGVELSEGNGRQLYVPKGFAHGYMTLTDDALVMYKVDDYYNKASEGGLIWNDADIGIAWPLPSRQAVLSEKDLVLPRLRDFTSPFSFLS